MIRHRRLLTLLLCLILTAGITFSVLLQTDVIASGQGASDEPAIDKLSRVFDAAEMIYAEVQDSIAEEVAGEESDEEPDFSEIEESIGKLIGYAGQLDGLISELAGMPDEPDESIGKTVLALREYLSILRDMATDMAQLGRYSVDLYDAVMILEEIDDDTDSYEVLAEQLLYTTSRAIELLEKIDPPDYLEITHGDLITRLREFNDFSADFYLAAGMNDPLRVYSCLYRMGRITRLFIRYEENLQADMDLQFKQAENRVKGPLALLHDELSRNIGLLKAA